MKIREILKKNNKGFSFEFFPPKTDKGKAALTTTIKVLEDYDPLYVSMTFGAGGTTQQRTKESVTMLLDVQNLEVMPHLTCIGASTDTIEKILDDYKQMGIENIMALRGDPPLDVKNFSFKGKDFFCARDLVTIIKKRNDFCMGVAVYPEGHIETVSLEQDLDFSKQKIDAGADFAVTQMFFDNTYFYNMIERMQKTGLSVPVLPGILPLTDVAKVRQFAAVCRVTIPAGIEQKMERFRDSPLDMEKTGIEFTIKQCRELIKNGFNQLHFFTLNRPQTITTVLDAIK